MSRKQFRKLQYKDLSMKHTNDATGKLECAGKCTVADTSRKCTRFKLNYIVQVKDAITANYIQHEEGKFGYIGS